MQNEKEISHADSKNKTTSIIGTSNSWSDHYDGNNERFRTSGDGDNRWYNRIINEGNGRGLTHDKTTSLSKEGFFCAAYTCAYS